MEGHAPAGRAVFSTKAGLAPVILLNDESKLPGKAIDTFVGIPHSATHARFFCARRRRHVADHAHILVEHIRKAAGRTLCFRAERAAAECFKYVAGRRCPHPCRLEL